MVFRGVNLLSVTALTSIMVVWAAHMGDLITWVHVHLEHPKCRDKRTITD